MLFRSLISSFAAAGLVTTSACDSPSVGPGGPDTGQFTVTITTATPLTFSGTASSVARPTVGFTAFFIGDDLDSGLTLVFEGVGRPGVGTYPIADFIATDATAPGQVLMSVNAPGDGHDLSSVNGTLTITASSSSAVSGRFTFQGSAGVAGVTGTVEGTFTTTHTDA